MPCSGTGALDTHTPDFTELFRAYRPMVHRALRQLGVRDAALDDASQDVFVVLHRRIAGFDQGRSLGNWLWGIARGVASTYRRGAYRRQRLHAEVPAAPAEPHLDDHIASQQALVVVASFLETLDEDKCAAFVMAEVEGCSGPEIAARLGVNLNTVYARLRAARSRFDAAVGPRTSRLRACVGMAWGWWPGQTTVASLSCVTAVALVVPTAVQEYRPQAEARTQLIASPVPSPSQKFRVQANGPGDAPRRRGATEDPTMKISMLAAITLSTTLASPALARPRAPKAEITHQDADAAARVQEGGMTRYDFDGDELTGEVLTPDGDLIMHRRPTKHPSLISVRDHFLPELMALATDI